MSVNLVDMNDIYTAPPKKQDDYIKQNEMILSNLNINFADDKKVDQFGFSQPQQHIQHINQPPLSRPDSSFIPIDPFFQNDNSDNSNNMLNFSNNNNNFIQHQQQMGNNISPVKDMSFEALQNNTFTQQRNINQNNFNLNINSGFVNNNNQQGNPMIINPYNNNMYSGMKNSNFINNIVPEKRDSSPMPMTTMNSTLNIETQQHLPDNKIESTNKEIVEESNEFKVSILLNI